MKIIARKENLLLVAVNDNADLSCIFDKGFIINLNGQRISPLLPVGTLTKDGDWEKYDVDYNDFNINNDYIKNALLGAAIGDAFGVPYEFMSRDAISKLDLKDMIGSNVKHDFNSYWGNRIPAGSWSDDTSMIVATMDSMIENKQINYDDIMKKFVIWNSEGKYSSNDFSFGLGSTVNSALKKYVEGTSPIYCGGINYMDNGNGSLMRILPFSLYCIARDLSDYDTYKIISYGSSITHGNEISIMACYLYTKLLAGAIKTKNARLAYSEMISSNYKSYFSDKTISEFSDILEDIYDLNPNKIDESGYVVDSLKTVIYSLLMSNSFESTIKRCVKIGYDTDTNSCIAGSIAGVIYGLDNVPQNWILNLKRKEYLEELADKFNKIIKEMGSNKTKTV